MHQTQQPTETDERSLAGTDAASAPARRGFTLRGRSWVYGATLGPARVLTRTGMTCTVVTVEPAAQRPWAHESSLAA